MGDRRPPPRAALVENARGLALAAFASPELIGTLLGCDAADAGRFKADALNDWSGLMYAVERAKSA
ncbi:MAG TPA: hypothetical protein VF628_11275 [Allosphingosinicella sp.]|jgi:hypothetical protein